MKTMLTPERLRELLSYNATSGHFTWVGRGRGIRRGRRAGSVGSNRHGYRVIVIDGASHYEQRLAWFWVHGKWPASVLRFQDGNRTNCAIDNLREGFYITTKYDHRTREGKAAYAKEWKAANPERYRERSLIKTFGVDLRWYGEKMVEQDGRCAICKSEETGTRLGKRLALAVDHNHTTNEVRGLLCRNCNTLIGHAKESREVLLSAIKYLDRYNGGEDAKPALLVVNSNKESA